MDLFINSNNKSERILKLQVNLGKVNDASDH